jgi:uncharacterized protein
MATIKKVTNGNIYVDGNNWLGRVEEATLADISSKMSEFTALGMAGTMEYASGFEMMEMSVTLHAYHADTLALIADPNATHRLQMRSSVDEHTSVGRTAQTPYVIYATVAAKKISGGAFKAHEAVKQEITFAVYALKMEQDGAPVIEFDANANIYKVNGVDKLATYRNNLGI